MYVIVHVNGYICMVQSVYTFGDILQDAVLKLSVGDSEDLQSSL